MNTKLKQNRLKILRAERDMAKTKLSGQPSFASLLSPNDKMRQRHIPVRDANRYAQSHNPQVATKLEPLPVLQGYPRAEFHSLNFPSACLRKTGARNKTSIGNFFPPFVAHLAHFQKTCEEKWSEMPRWCFSDTASLEQTTFKEERRRGGRGHFNLGPSQPDGEMRTHTHTLEMLPGERFRKQNLKLYKNKITV